MKKIKIVISKISLLLVVGAFMIPLPLGAQKPVAFDRDVLSIETGSGEIFEFKVELAETDEQKSRGLMYRREMGEREGMLFLYRRDQVVTMWMANTFLPLDMLFIEQNGRIARIQAHTVPQSREVVSSRKRVRAVLELNAGTAQKLGISVGDRVLYERLNPLK